MKLILPFLILLTFTIKAQSERPVYRNIDCNEELEYDTIKIAKDEYDYKIVFLYFKVEYSDTIYIGDIILPNFNSESNKIYLRKVLKDIGKKENFSGFNAFGDCESRNISYQAKFPSKNQLKHLNMFRIGEFYFE